MVVIVDVNRELSKFENERENCLNFDLELQQPNIYRDRLLAQVTTVLASYFANAELNRNVFDFQGRPIYLSEDAWRYSDSMGFEYKIICNEAFARVYVDAYNFQIENYPTWHKDLVNQICLKVPLMLNSLNANKLLACGVQREAIKKAKNLTVGVKTGTTETTILSQSFVWHVSFWSRNRSLSTDRLLVLGNGLPFINLLPFYAEQSQRREHLHFLGQSVQTVIFDCVNLFNNAKLLNWPTTKNLQKRPFFADQPILFDKFYGILPELLRMETGLIVDLDSFKVQDHVQVVEDGHISNVNQRELVNKDTVLTWSILEKFQIFSSPVEPFVNGVSKCSVTGSTLVEWAVAISYSVENKPFTLLINPVIYLSLLWTNMKFRRFTDFLHDSIVILGTCIVKINLSTDELLDRMINKETNPESLKRLFAMKYLNNCEIDTLVGPTRLKLAKAKNVYPNPLNFNSDVVLAHYRYVTCGTMFSVRDLPVIVYDDRK